MIAQELSESLHQQSDLGVIPAVTVKPDKDGETKPNWFVDDMF